MGGVAPGSDRTVMSALSTNSHTCIVLFPFSCSLFSFHRSHTNVSDPENVQFLVRPGLLFVLLNIKTSHHYQPHPSSPHAHCLGQPVFELFILQIGERPSLAAFHWFATYWLCLVRRLLVSFTNRFLLHSALRTPFALCIVSPFGPSRL